MFLNPLNRINNIITQFVLSCICLFLIVNGLYSQNADSLTVLKKAKKEIKTLASKNFAGRGYTFEGHIKAAEYIAKRFKDNKLVSQNQTYLQPFSISINKIEGATLKLDNKKLVIGKDFIVHSESEPTDKKCDVINLNYGLPTDWELNKDKVKDKLVCVKEGIPNNLTIPDSIRNIIKTSDFKIQLAEKYQAGGVLFIKEKLTGTFAGEMYSIPIVEVLSKSLKIIPQMAYIKVVTKIETISTQNVVGWIKGKKYPDSAIVLCAHYDHLGRIGKAVFRGANDNASGISFLLSLVDYYSKPENKPRYSLIFIAFGAEETGLKGSLFYVNKEPLFPLSSTKCVFNFDLIGNGESGVMVIGALTYPDLFKQVTQVNDLQHFVTPLQSRTNAPNSDHYPFTLKDIPALFFYTQGGAPHYHDVFDVPEAIKLPAFYRLRGLIIKVLDKIY